MLTKVFELTRPLGLTVGYTQTLDDAAHTLAKTGTGYVVITDMSDQPVAVLTEGELEDLKLLEPNAWSSKQCASVVTTQQPLSVDALVQEVVELFTRDEIRPLLVFDAGAAVGVLHPTEVFQWCAENQPAVLEQLASQAVQTEAQPG